MSGIERSVFVRQPCLCGHGELIVNYCTPDHSYAKWYDHHFELLMECDACKTEYELIDQKRKAVVIRLADKRERQALEKEYQRRAKEFMKRADVQSYLRQFEALVASVGPATKKYRIFQQAELTAESIASFRNSLREFGNAQLIRRYAGPDRVPIIMKVIGVKDDALLRELAGLKQFEKQSQAPLTPAIDPLCSLSQQAYFKHRNNNK